MRYFNNPYDDYTPEAAEGLISANKLHVDSKVTSVVQSKWDWTMDQFTHLDFSDTSVYTGTSGIALLKLLKDPNDQKNLEEVKNLLCLRKLKYKRSSFLCGDAGPLAIGAVVCHRLKENQETEKLIEKLLAMSDTAVDCKSDLPNEYLYGRAGYLFALLYVNKNIDPPPIGDQIIREVIEAIISCGRTESRLGKYKCPLMYQWHNKHYFGAAHGVSGILYLLLQAKEYLNERELNNFVKPTIDYMESTMYSSGNYPSSMGNDDDKYVQWCHGAPGFVYLFSAAYKAFGEPKHLQLALSAGEVVWTRGLLKKGYSICHGVSGNAYCFLELFQLTKDVKHLYRAIKFAEWCIAYTKQHEEYSPDRPLSLFEGIAGTMYLLLDIQDPMNAKFPGYTL